MKYFFILVTLFSLTACGKSAEQKAADDMAARLKASHDRFQHEKSPEGQAELAKKAGL